VSWAATFILKRAAFMADSYDRNAQGEVRYNLTDKFHLCGLIERASTMPKSGATHRRYLPGSLMDEAKAMFCRAHKVPHPSVWEWETKRTCEQVREALLHASAVEQG
jgi:hypothetical protein